MMMARRNQRRCRLLTAFCLLLTQGLVTVVSSYAFSSSTKQRPHLVDLPKQQKPFLSAENAYLLTKKEREVEDSHPSSFETTTRRTDDTTTTTNLNLENLPPVLRDIVLERREYQMNLGRAMDTLRKDMETILDKKPDFSIFHPDIRAADPSGVQINGLDKYKSAFAFFQTFVKFWFSPRTSSIQFRMVYDECRSAIRISWHAVLVPRVLPLTTGPLHVDAISYYQMDAPSGKIIEHRIEKLVMNNNGIVPPYGIWSLLQQDALRLGTPQLQPQVGVPMGAVVAGGPITHSLLP